MQKTFDGDNYFVPRIGERIRDSLYKDPDEYEVTGVVYYFEGFGEPYCDVFINAFEVESFEAVGINIITLARKHKWNIPDVYDSLFNLE